MWHKAIFFVHITCAQLSRWVITAPQVIQLFIAQEIHYYNNSNDYGIMHEQYIINLLFIGYLSISLIWLAVYTFMPVALMQMLSQQTRDILLYQMNNILCTVAPKEFQ